MLQKIREKITGWVAWAILITIGLVFAVWGIDFSFTPRTVAAKVDGEDVPIEPVRRAYQEQLSRFQQAFGRDVPEEFTSEMRRGVIEQFVRRELLQQRVTRARLRVGDEQLMQHIQSIPAFQVGGQFSIDAYRAALAGAGYTPRMFEADQRRVLEIQQLQNAIALSTFVTRNEIERRIALERELREIEWVSLPLDRFLDEVEISDADVEERYQASADRWMTLESVDLEYLELRLDQLAAEVEISEDELRAFYEAEVRREPERYSGRERRKAAHILVRTGEDAQQRIEALRARIEAGEEFAAVAAEASEDPGSARAGGELGWVERGFMVPAFENALFALEEGELSAPVRSEFGWHLILLQELETSGGASFEEAREELIADYGRRMAEDRFYEQAEALAQQAFETSDSLQPVAAELGLELRTVAGVTRGGGPGIAASPEVIAAAWREAVLDARENSPLIEVEDGHAVVIRVAAHRPQELQPLETVAEQIAVELRRERATERLRALGQQALARLAAGDSVAEVAESLEGDFVAGITVVRDDVTVPPHVSSAAFAAARPEAGAAAVVSAEAGSGYYAIRVLSATPGGLDLLRPQEQRELNDRVHAGRASQELQAYLEHMRQGAKVTIFESALQ